LWSFTVLQPNLIPWWALTVHCLAVYQISGQSNNAFVFYDFYCLTEKKKEMKLSQFSKVHISEMPDTILLKFGMWGGDVDWHIHWKNHLVLSKCHGASIRENCNIVLLINNSRVWHAGFLGYTTYYHVSWLNCKIHEVMALISFPSSNFCGPHPSIK